MGHWAKSCTHPSLCETDKRLTMSPTQRVHQLYNPLTLLKHNSQFELFTKNMITLEIKLRFEVFQVFQGGKREGVL